MAISNLTDVELIMTDGQGNQVWKTTLADVRLSIGLEASFNSIISAKDGGYIVVGSKNDSVWLAKLDVQHGGSGGLQLLSFVEVALIIALVVTLIVVTKKKGVGKGRVLNGLEAKQTS